MPATGLERALPMGIGPSVGKWTVGNVRVRISAGYQRQSMSSCVTDSTVSELQERILEMYDALSPSLLSYLHNLRISVDEAEDVVQEVFLRLANHLRKGGEESNLRSWTYQVAHNLAMDIHRTARRNRSNSEVGDEVENELVDPTSDPEQAYLNKEEIKRVQDAMEQLTKQQRNSVLLRAQGLRYAEIASVLRVSEQRALVLVKRALLRLAGGL